MPLKRRRTTSGICTSPFWGIFREKCASPLQECGADDYYATKVLALPAVNGGRHTRASPAAPDGPARCLNSQAKATELLRGWQAAERRGRALSSGTSMSVSVNAANPWPARAAYVAAAIFIGASGTINRVVAKWVPILGSL
jgi:hypothetical protein